MANNCVVVGLFVLSLTAIVDCSKILVIVAVASPSHFNVFTPVIEELASRKHDVTVQSYYALKQPLPNVKELKIKMSASDADRSIMKEFFRRSLVVGPIGQIGTFTLFIKQGCIDYINDTSTKALLSAGMQYDVIILDALFAQCQAAVASLVGEHIIYFYPGSGAPWKESAVPMPFSYVPNFMALTPSKMTFLQRLENTINTLGVRYINHYMFETIQQEVISELLPLAGTIKEIENKVEFILTNADPVVNSPRPTMPNFVNCGGMHCKKAKPLPKDLNDFVESSGEDGFVIFGLGSNMKSEFLSPEELQAIMSALSRLKQKVVWKFEAKLENIPENIKITDWMPQQDLLGHPKARLFITHSGLLSLQETIYHGVPVIGIPFFADQRGNIMRMKELGIGEHFDFLNLTADGFYEVISTVLSDKSYFENMKKYSAVFKDQPERPIDRAVFWTEYVIRHNGTRHFRSAAEDLNFFQYFLLDVIGFILLILAIILGLTVYIFKFTLSKLCKRKQSEKEIIKKRD